MRTKARQEQRACLNLANQGISSYCPKVVFDDNKSEALFPGYIFLPQDNIVTELSGKVRSTRGVMGFVRFGKEIASISASLLSSIYERETANKVVLRYKNGQKLLVQDGPLKNLEAIFQCRDGMKRSLVLIEMLGKEQKIKCPNEWLKAI